MRHLVTFFILLMLSFAPLPGAPRPNILIIVSDDQGYVDAGFQGGKDVITPHLDRLAQFGVRFTSGYVSHPFCSPSRAGLLTGRYQARFGHENNPVYDPLDQTEGLPLTERLLPQFMKDAGYRTGWVGKWHLGSSPRHTPWQRGFEETFGFIGSGHRYQDWQPNGRQYTLPLIRNGETLSEVPAHLTTKLGEEAAAFIRRHSEKPWMLYLAFNAPHDPREPTAEREARFSHVKKDRRRKYLAQVSLMDDAIGTVTAALAESGQTKRTLVFFFSDNGGHERKGADNGPLRGGKTQLYEGGVRVPFIVSWPGTLAAGTTFDAPVLSLDVFATSLAMAGLSMPTDRPYDGVNLVPYITGKKKPRTNASSGVPPSRATNSARIVGNWSASKTNPLNFTICPPTRAKGAIWPQLNRMSRPASSANSTIPPSRGMRYVRAVGNLSV